MTPAQEGYRAYLRSSHWQAVRRIILARAQEHCERCRAFCGEAEVLSSSEIDFQISELRAYGHEPCGVCGYWCQFQDEDVAEHLWLEVHHLTYERLGCEFDSDLIALCCNCHEEVSRREHEDAFTRRLIPAAFKPGMPAEAEALARLSAAVLKVMA